MKHVVWLLLAACCLAFGQVQPAASPAAGDAHCTCCDCAGACGMPECAPPPVARTPVFAQNEARPVKAEVARRATPAPAPVVAFPPLCPSIKLSPHSRGLAHGLPVVDTPVFLVHCSLLI
ncbi:MAG: hypothetical protein KF897_08860 [Opitutaceae bacterium]|nr:hypothetical protein [Opitutaceae bacterium]